MVDTPVLLAKVLEVYDRRFLEPYSEIEHCSAWNQFYFSHSDGSEREGFAFFAPRSECSSVEFFIAVAVHQALQFFDHPREDIRSFLSTAGLHPVKTELAQFPPWIGLANKQLEGSAYMIAALQRAYPDLQPRYEIYELTGMIDSFGIAESEHAYAAFYWYSTA